MYQSLHSGVSCNCYISLLTDYTDDRSFASKLSLFLVHLPLSIRDSGSSHSPRADSDFHCRRPSSADMADPVTLLEAEECLVGISVGRAFPSLHVLESRVRLLVSLARLLPDIQALV